MVVCRCFSHNFNKVFKNLNFFSKKLFAFHYLQNKIYNKIDFIFSLIFFFLKYRVALLPLFMYSNKLMAIAAVLGSETKRRSEMIKFSRHLEYQMFFIYTYI